MHFNLVDSVLERTADRIVTTKAVSNAEEYLTEHFPSFPVLPGVMMLEAMVQAARTLLAGREDAADGPWVVAEVRNVKYGNMVRPGQVLIVTVELSGHEDGRWSFKGGGQVNGQQAVSGRFVLRRPINPPGHDA